MISVAVAEASQVGEARRCMMARAAELGFDETGAARAGHRRHGAGQ